MFKFFTYVLHVSSCTFVTLSWGKKRNFADSAKPSESLNEHSCQGQLTTGRYGGFLQETDVRRPIWTGNRRAASCNKFTLAILINHSDNNYSGHVSHQFTIVVNVQHTIRGRGEGKRKSPQQQEQKPVRLRMTRTVQNRTHSRRNLRKRGGKS